MRKILLIFLTILIGLNNANAGTTGKLTGKITDAATGEPLPFVNVILLGTNLGAATDINGFYTILNISPGKYTIRAQSVGYQPVIAENISISIDLTTTQDFQLSEAAVELEAVVVQGTRDFQKDVTSSQALISAEEIANLPVAEFDDVLQLQAGVTRGADGSFHIRGGRSQEIAYWVNGVSITDAYDNSRGIEIDNSSIQELQVISGTFNAEYGNAMSGIINTVTKEGGNRYSGDIKVYSSDYVSNFTSYFPHIDDLNPLENYNLQGSLSGPFPFIGQGVRFFVNGRYNYDDGWLYGERRYTINGDSSDNKIVPMNWSKRWIGQANISFYPLQELKVNTELLYSKENFQDYDHAFRWVPEGNVEKFTNSYNGTLTINHMLSSVTFYTLKGSYFFKDFEEYLFENPFDSRYLHPDSLNTGVSYAFRTMGTNLHQFFRETNTLSVKGDLTSQVSKNHLLKIGAEARTHKLKFDDYTLEPATLNGVPIEPFQSAIPGENTPNRTKYENKPFEIAAYFQDKIEFEDVIINIGFRYDYFDSNGDILVDPSDPNIYLPIRSPGEVGRSEENWDNIPIAEREQYFYKKATAKSQWSPRFGIAYPISAEGVLHFSYGHFLQIPSFQYLYNRGKFLVPNTGSQYGVYGNPDLEAQKTVMYEIGFKQEFLNDFIVDVTGFYRDVRNWITAGPFTATRSNVSYSVYTNKDYSNVKGITLSVNKRFSNFYAFDVNYTFQVAEGSNSSPEEEYFSQQGNAEPKLFLLPMDWDQRNLVNVSLYIGGQDWGGSLIGRYGTGLPYTPAITQYTAERGITSGLERNSRRRPNQFTIDLKLHKIFPVAGIDVTTFLRVFNLLDNKTIVNVFGDTGKPDYTTEAQNVGEDPNRPNTIAEYLRYPWHYGEPRLVQFGFEFSF